MIIVLEKKVAITTVLFLAGALHTMVFSVIQAPETFISKDLANYPLLLKILLYAITVTASCLHQPIVKRFGVKKVLTYGLIANILAILCLLGHHFWSHIFPDFLFLIPSMIFLGAALPSVMNCLITYTLLEYPTKNVLVITALFSFLNGGVMIGPFLLNVLRSWGMTWSALAVFLGLLLIALVCIELLFSEPAYPKHFEPLRSGSLLWKEQYRRLPLYILAIFLYSLTESTFTLWGDVYLSSTPQLSASVAENGVSIFWLFMIIGQLLLLLPLYYFEPRRVFYFLIPIIAWALLYISSNTRPLEILIGFALGGIGCVAIFPIILSLLEMELIQLTMIQRYEAYLPLLETGISFLMAGYLLGGAVIDFWIHWAQSSPIEPQLQLGILFILGTMIVMIYLNKTRKILPVPLEKFLQRKDYAFFTKK